MILGSLPGEASLAARQYYAHPGNHFWRLMEKVIGRELVALDYPQRVERIQDQKIALWDMVASGVRKGSLDQALRPHRLQKVAGLSKELSDLRLIAFNGKTAAVLGAKMAGIDHVAQLQLPSSSAANTMPLVEKLRYWERLTDFL